MNVKLKTYHSALQPELDELKELSSFYKDGSFVCQHDITEGLLPLFNKADVIYIEPSWRNGFELFQKRAGVSGLKYQDYLTSIQDVIITMKVPTFMIGGKHMTKIIKPHHSVDIILHGYKSKLFIWNHNIIDCKDNFECIEFLSKKYNCVLDFCCGYGNTLPKFKNFIATDINSKCVYYVAKKYMSYENTIS